MVDEGLSTVAGARRSRIWLPSLQGKDFVRLLGRKVSDRLLSVAAGA